MAASRSLLPQLQQASGGSPLSTPPASRSSGQKCAHLSSCMLSLITAAAEPLCGVHACSACYVRAGVADERDL